MSGNTPKLDCDTGEFLENYDLKDLLHTYTLAYLQNKRVGINGIKPEVDRHWNFGEFDLGVDNAPTFEGTQAECPNSYLFRTDDNAAMLILDCPQISDNDQATESQTISSNLHEQFINVIAYFIAQGYSELPTDKLKIGLCVNHHNTHWTLLMSQFEGLDKIQYKALAKQYHQRAQRTKENTDPNGVEKRLGLRINNVKNFLLKQKGITFNHRNKDDELVLGNCVLPIKVKKISLSHYDSLGSKTYCNDLVKAATTHFIKQNKAHYRAGKSTRQKGNTCGDWTVYNAFRLGVMFRRPPAPSSKQLRMLAENTTINNAQQILTSRTRRLEAATLDSRVCVTTNARRIVDEMDTQNGVRQGEEGPQDDPWFNDTFFWFGLTTKVLISVLTGYVFFAYTAPLMLLDLTSATVGALAIGTLSGQYLFDGIAKLFFGNRNIELALDSQNQPYRDRVDASIGLSEFMGLRAPYHKTLNELEFEISELISPHLEGPKKDKRCQLLTHYFAKEIVKKNPSCFYEADKVAVRATDYVNKQKASKAIEFLKPHQEEPAQTETQAQTNAANEDKPQRRRKATA